MASSWTHGRISVVRNDKSVTIKVGDERTKLIPKDMESLAGWLIRTKRSIEIGED